MAETEEVAFDNWQDAFDDLEENKDEEVVVAEQKSEEVEVTEQKQEGKSETKEPIDPKKVFLDKL